jgi:hypothetical protein
MPKMRTTVSLSLMIGSLGLAVLGGEAKATGTDQVVHASNACKWSEEWNRNNDVDQTSYQPSGITHLGFPLDVSHSAICGIDRFNLTNLDGLRDLDVRLNNHNPTPATVVCTAYAVRPDGTVVKSVSLEATFVGAHRVDFGGSLNQSVAYGSYSVSCELPRLVTLNNILQREY